jgi:sugar phosphate isomerase/epimerase
MKTKQNRRDFIKKSAAGTIGILGLSLFAASPFRQDDRKKSGVGLQLYTIRDAMGEDVAGSLKKVSEMGYKYLELAKFARGKFYGFAPVEFKKMVNDLDMEALSSHTQVEASGINLDNAKKMADAHAELGVKYCIQPWINDPDRNIESYKRMIAEWNKVGEIMKNVGIQFGYHNHNFEFANLNGVVPYYDIFLKEMDPALITMELDLYWATKAGQNPVEMFSKYPGRFQLLHFKDMARRSDPFFTIIKDDITSVGSGLIDFRSIWAARETAGAKYLFVEDDNQGMGKPFEGIKTSIDNLNSRILV